MGDKDSDGGHFGFCSIKKSLKGAKVAPAGLLIWTIRRFQKANKTFYYPNLVILPVDNNEHQRIDDVSTDRISYDIRSVKTMGFAL